MKLYQGNAKDLVGKKIDCKVRRFGYYPMTVIEINGELYVKDAVGACMSIPILTVTGLILLSTRYFDTKGEAGDVQGVY